MKNLFYTALFCTCFLLLGAGCTATEEIPIQVQQGTPDTTEPSAPTILSDITSKPIKGFNITVEEQNDTEITFSWQLPDHVDEPEKFRLVRDEEKNPVYDGKHYWLQADGTRRDIVWDDFPTSTQYVRICTFDVKNDTCLKYSDEVVVKSKN